MRLVATNRVTARDVMDTAFVVTTRGALEKLQETLGVVLIQSALSRQHRFPVSDGALRAGHWELATES